MKNINIFKFLIILGVMFLTTEHTNASSKLLLEELGKHYSGIKLKKNFYSSYKKKTQHSKFIQKRFYSKKFPSTFTQDLNSFTKEDSMDKITKLVPKQLQIIDIGRKDYKFDPKTSLYYYEDTGDKDIKDIAKPEMKDFGTFFEFDVKKK